MIVEFTFGRLNSLRELKAPSAALKLWHSPFNHIADDCLIHYIHPLDVLFLVEPLTLSGHEIRHTFTELRPQCGDPPSPTSNTED